MNTTRLTIALLLVLFLSACREEEPSDPNATEDFVLPYLGNFSFRKDVTVHRITVADTTFLYQYTGAVTTMGKDTIELPTNDGGRLRCRLLSSGTLDFYSINSADQAHGSFVGLDSIYYHYQSSLGQSGYSESNVYGSRVQ